MLEFKPLTIQILKDVLPIIQKNQSLCSDLSAGYLYMWYMEYDVQIATHKNTFVLKLYFGEQPAFSYPMGDNVDEMIDAVKSYVYQNDYALRFFAVDDILLEKIRSDSRLQPAKFAYERQWSDYVYSFEDALEFKGKKFSGQRNHINKFKKLYGNPDIRRLTVGDSEIVFNFLKKYEEEHTDGGFTEKMEFEQTKNLFNVHEQLGLYSAGLFVDGQMVAFSIGEVVKDSLIIHVEKGIRKYEGVYPTMYSGFVGLIKSILGYSLKYVNREDDAGDEGIRTSKMQYHPILMANKNLVHVYSPALKHDCNAVIHLEGVFLTKIRETDKTAYLRLNTDIENNKYWGYDYRDDSDYIGDITENTFYDFVYYDMNAGDSINFSIRLSEDGEMIGEVILWNFTINGFVEIGCRLFPEYQNKGYGKKAFKLAVEYATKTLGLKVRAKCFRQNLSSYKMITSSGLVLSDEDDKFYYFK